MQHDRNQCNRFHKDTLVCMARQANNISYVLLHHKFINTHCRTVLF